MRIRCQLCKSEDVRRDAFVAYNTDTQSWELAEIFEAGSCNNCEDRVTLEEIPDVKPVPIYAYVSVTEHKNGLSIDHYFSESERDAEIRPLIVSEWDAEEYGLIPENIDAAIEILSENGHDLYIHYHNIPKIGSTQS